MDDDKAPPDYNEDEGTHNPTASDAKGSSSSLSSSSSSSSAPHPLAPSAPSTSLFAMIPSVTRDNQPAYHRANNVSYIREEPGKPCSIVGRTVAHSLGSLTTTPNLTIEDIHTQFVPSFVVLPTTVFLNDSGSRKDLRSAVISKPNDRSTWLRALVNPDAVVGMVADGPLRTTLYVEHHRGEYNLHSLGIQMPLEEVRAAIDQALRRQWAGRLVNQS
ncbi:hypothetical protein DFJ73DRAFT_814167 [Zopfochytrium polystomum]|nr:hypothetical protein DFJ73DRAFT_814167 [Zopfochytrium polystomum]